MAPGVVLFAVFFLGAGAGGGAGGGLPGPPPRYTFDGGVISCVACDTNRDGKEDRFAYYEKGELVRIEIDNDHDGVIDERLFCKHRPPRLEWQVKRIDGHYRLVPYGDRPSALPIRAERLVDGKWTGTYTSKTVKAEAEGETITDIAEYKDGVIQSSSQERRGQSWRSEYTDGKLVKKVHINIGIHKWIQSEYAGPDQTWIIEYFEDGAAQKRLIMSQRPADKWRRYEKPTATGWTGDFEDTERASIGGRECVTKTTYRKGIMVSSETTDAAKGTVVRRFVLEADGSQRIERDVAGGGQIDFVQTVAPGEKTWQTGKRLVEGKWLEDFELREPSSASVYKGGRLVRSEWGVKGNTTFYEYPTPDSTICGTNGKPEKWIYRSADGEVEREERDTDGDGKPDLVIDYVKLTVEERGPATKPN